LEPLSQAARDGGAEEGPGLPDGGGLDKAQIRLFIKVSRGDIRECFARALERVPGLHGKVTVRFTINADGSVSDPTAVLDTVGDEGLVRCMASKMTMWRFPAPVGGGRVSVTYPFLFKNRQASDAGLPDAGLEAEDESP
jgi:TonB family protein